MKILLIVAKPMHRAWMESLFEQRPDGSYTITRQTDLGKAICGMVRYSQLPLREEVPSGSLILHLPNTHSLALAPGRFLYFDREGQLRINDLLEVFFNIDFDRYYLQGIKLGMMKKDVIESFIIQRGLANLFGDNETLKKRQYRDELDLFKKRMEQLRKKAYYRNEKIELALAK